MKMYLGQTLGSTVEAVLTELSNSYTEIHWLTNK
jgi:hypothetical protein